MCVDFQTLNDSLFKDMLQRRFTEETSVQRNLRKIKTDEIKVLHELTMADCIQKLEHKTIKMLQKRLGSSLNTQLVQDELNQ